MHWTKKIEMMLAGDSEENDEKIQAFRAAQLHTRQAQKFHEKANSLEELLNLQSLHANVHIMPATLHYYRRRYTNSLEMQRRR